MVRTLENVRWIRNIVSIAIFFLMIVPVSYGIYMHVKHAEEPSIGIPLGEGVIGIGTIFLALATFYLAFSEMIEGIETRQNDEEIAEKDRRRLRLKEQLEGLYSPIYGIGERDFIEFGNHRDRRDVRVVHHVYTIMNQIRSRYRYLALEAVKELLDDYYQINKRLSVNPDWIDTIQPLWDEIIQDFNDLVTDYEDLTT